MQLKPLSSYSIHSLYSKPNNRHVQLHSWRFSVSSAVNNADVWLLSAPRAVGSDWSRLTAEHVFCSTDSLAWGPECQSVSWSVCPTLQCRERWHDGRLLSCAYTFIIPEMRIPTVLLLHLHQVTKRKKKCQFQLKNCWNFIFLYVATLMFLQVQYSIFLVWCLGTKKPCFVRVRKTSLLGGKYLFWSPETQLQIFQSSHQTCTVIHRRILLSLRNIQWFLSYKCWNVVSNHIHWPRCLLACNFAAIPSASCCCLTFGALHAVIFSWKRSVSQPDT